MDWMDGAKTGMRRRRYVEGKRDGKLNNFVCFLLYFFFYTNSTIHNIKLLGILQILRLKLSCFLLLLFYFLLLLLFVLWLEAVKKRLYYINNLVSLVVTYLSFM